MVVRDEERGDDEQVRMIQLLLAVLKQAAQVCAEAFVPSQQQQHTNFAAACDVFKQKDETLGSATDGDSLRHGSGKLLVMIRAECRLEQFVPGDK